MRPFPQAAYWRVWHNMQSLIDRGMDPLRVLIDRAHEKNMAFLASLRMPGFGGMNPDWNTVKGGGGLAVPELRDHQFRVLEELVTDYGVDGVEIDVSYPGGWRNMQPEDAERMLPVLSDYVEAIADMVKTKSGGRCDLGARMYPTETLNREDGLDVREWLRRGCLDYVAPLRYGYFLLDPNQPIDWLIEIAHAADTAVYGFLQPYVRDPATGAPAVEYPTPEQMRAASANYFAKGVDGLYTWFLHWPPGDTERSILTELGDSDLVMGKDKHYVLSRDVQNGEPYRYPQPIPFEIPHDATGKPFSVPFYLADDFEDATRRIGTVRVRKRVYDLVSADRMDIRLNDRSLQGERCLRTLWDRDTPYNGQWLEYDLRDVCPRKGYNQLEFVLESRPADLNSSLRIEEIEIKVGYSIF
ncbi:MAG: hypothetical protein FJY97_11775 [candidate division Zixibacteria bacterium]|nr:hypothetical protein [candidate division Zixibacteria bacterium]